MSDIKVECSGKVRFPAFGKADRAAEKLRRRDDGCHVRAYHCRHCAGFHVGESRVYGRRDERKEPTP